MVVYVENPGARRAGFAAAQSGPSQALLAGSAVLIWQVSKLKDYYIDPTAQE